MSDGRTDVTRADRRSGEACSLRRIMNHLIQEYARHNGHADRIREGIHGAFDLSRARSGPEHGCALRR